MTTHSLGTRPQSHFGLLDIALSFSCIWEAPKSVQPSVWRRGGPVQIGPDPTKCSHCCLHHCTAGSHTARPTPPLYPRSSWELGVAVRRPRVGLRVRAL